MPKKFASLRLLIRQANSAKSTIPAPRLRNDWREGIGITNCRERLRALYGDDASVDMSNHAEARRRIRFFAIRLDDQMISAFIVDDEEPARAKLRRWLVGERRHRDCGRVCRRLECRSRDHERFT